MTINTDIQIIDCGRGPQLSTSRITVQDLVPYFQRKLSHEQILEIMPVLTAAEIQAVERYVRDNYQAVMELDRHIRERNASRNDTPAAEKALERGGAKMAALREEFKLRKQRREMNGAQPAG